MKRQVLLVLLLLVCFSFQLSSETLDCQKSFELGKITAKEEYKVWGWYLLGIGAGILELYFSWALGDYLLRGDYVTAAVAVAVATNAIALSAAFRFPLPSRIVPSSIDVDLECYRKGYKQRTTWKNYGAFVLGELTPVLVSFAVLSYFMWMN